MIDRVRVLAAAILDGPWSHAAIGDRLRATTGTTAPWLDALVRAVVAAHPEPPALALDAFATWLATQRACIAAVHARWTVRHWPPLTAEMADSRWSVPPLATPREVAMWLGIGPAALRALVHPLARPYRYRWIAKRHGHRLLEIPSPALRWVQRTILDGILTHIPPHAAAHGFRTGRSIKTFATPHASRDVVLHLDLAAFFTSVFARRVAAIFRTAGYPDQIAYLLARLATHCTPPDVLAAGPEHDADTLARLRAPHLPQGAPTSGALANLAAFGLDVRITALADSLDATYTRYADDLALSGDRPLAHAAPTIVARIGAIAIEEGFTVNFRKTRVMTAATRQQLAGLVVNAGPAVPRHEVERVRAILHNCVRTGPASQNRDAHPDFRAHLLGRVAWIASIDPRKGDRLRAVFDQIRWT